MLTSTAFKRIQIALFILLLGGCTPDKTPEVPKLANLTIPQNISINGEDENSDGNNIELPIISEPTAPPSSVVTQPTPDIVIDGANPSPPPPSVPLKPLIPAKTESEILKEDYKSNTNSMQDAPARNIHRTSVFFDKSILNPLKAFKAKTNNLSASASVSFIKEWSQGFNGSDIEIVVLDADTIPKSAIDGVGYFSNAKVSNKYVDNYFNEQTGNKKTYEHVSLGHAIDGTSNSRFIIGPDAIKGKTQTNNITAEEKALYFNYHLNADNFILRDDKPSTDATKSAHPKNVAKTISILLDSPTIYSSSPSHLALNGPTYSYTTLINGYANKGVRIFNRSYHVGTKTAPGDLDAYAPAILYRNALFINSAGNNNKESEPVNFIMQESKLRDGWMIVAGYSQIDYLQQQNGTRDPYVGTLKVPEGEDKQLIRSSVEKYYAKGKNIYRASHACGIGKLDCITAPFVIVDDRKGEKAWFFGGTSAGAPMTSAVAAAILQKYPWMSNSNIKDSILTTATKVTDKAGKQIQEDIDDEWGWGILDAGRAMNGPAKFYEKDFIADVQVNNANDGYNFISSFNNDINGTKGLVKKGNGWLLLSGINTYSGATQVESGGLWVSQSISSPITIETNGTLRGQDTVFSIINNKGVFFSDGNATINGEYKQDAGAVLKTNFGNTLSITGAASLAGELDFVDYVNSKPLSYDVLKAANISGTFSSIKSSSPLIEINTTATTYSTTALKVEAKRASATNAINKITPETTIGAQNLDALFALYDKRVFKKIISDEEAAKLGDYELKGGQRSSDLTLKTKEELKTLSYEDGDHEEQLDPLGLELRGLFNLDASTLTLAAYTQAASIYSNQLLLSSLLLTNSMLNDHLELREDGLNLSASYIYDNLRNTQGTRLNNHGLKVSGHYKGDAGFIALSIDGIKGKLSQSFNEVNDYTTSNTLGFNAILGMQENDDEGATLTTSISYHHHNNKTNRLIQSAQAKQVNINHKGNLLTSITGLSYRMNFEQISIIPNFHYIYEKITANPFNEHEQLGLHINSDQALAMHSLNASLTANLKVEDFGLNITTGATKDLKERSLRLRNNNNTNAIIVNNKIATLRYNLMISSYIEYRDLRLEAAYRLLTDAVKNGLLSNTLEIKLGYQF